MSATNSASCAVTTVDPCDDPAWERLSRGPRGSLFTAPPWLRAVRDTYARPLQARITDRGGLAYCELDDVMGARIVSIPYCDFADPIVDDAATWHSLVDPLITPGRPFRMRTLHDQVATTDPRFSLLGEDFWHGVELQVDLDEKWAALGSTARRNVRKARNAGVTVRFDDTSAGVDTFFDLHLATRRAKHGMIAQPRQFFHEIHRHFVVDDAVSIAVAELDGHPIAAIFLLEWNGRAYYKFNASDPAALEARPNDLVMWECIEHAAGRGNDVLDLGLSDADQDGLVRYKRKWASLEGHVRTLVAGPAKTPEATALGPVLGGITSLLTDPDVPAHVAEAAGDLLYPFFA